MPVRCLLLSKAFVPRLNLDPFSGNNIIKPLQRALSVTEGGTPIKLTVSFKEGEPFYTQ